MLKLWHYMATQPLADSAETRVSVPSESCHLGTLNENRRVRKGLTIKIKTKKSWTQAKSMGDLPLTLQKAKFSAWQNLIRAHFHLCVDSPTCFLPQLEHNFEAPGQS